MDIYSICENDDLQSLKQINYKDDLNNYWSLSCAAGSLNLVHFFLKNHKPELNLYEGISWATRKGRKKVVERLIEEGCDPNFNNNELSFSAIEMSFTNILELFLSHGVDFSQYQFARHAVIYGQANALEFLCDYGFDLRTHAKKLLSESKYKINQDLKDFINKYAD